MGLFFNANEHPEMFKNNIERALSNQNTFKFNYLTLKLENQKRLNEQLKQFVHEFKSLYEGNEKRRDVQWRSLEMQIGKMKQRQSAREMDFNQSLIALKSEVNQLKAAMTAKNQSQERQLKDLAASISNYVKSLERRDKNWEKMLNEFAEKRRNPIEQHTANLNDTMVVPVSGQEMVTSPDLKERIHLLEKGMKAQQQLLERNLKITEQVLEELATIKRLDGEWQDQKQKYEITIDALNEQMNSLTNIVPFVEKQQLWQREFEKNVNERLDQQSALLDKVMRQLYNLRSIVYERTNFLAEKLREIFKNTTSQLYQWISGKDEPLRFITVKDGKKSFSDIDKLKG